MAILLMVVLVGVMLSALVVPMIIQQDRTTRFAKSRVRALDAAQAGIDVALARIRGTVDPSGVVDNAKLPCASTAAPITGQVNSAGIAAYSVIIDYFLTDPVKPGAAAMTCVSNYGTYQSGVGTPGYARLKSTGTEGTAVNGSTKGRTLYSTYVFKTNDDALGGLIKIAPNVAAAAALCLDAGSVSPAVGTIVVLDYCNPTSLASSRQVFAYRRNLTLQLASTVVTTPTSSYPGLCLAFSDPPAISNPVTLAKCPDPSASPPESVPYTQQWSLNVWGEFQAGLPSSVTTGTLSTLCMSTSAQTAGTRVQLATCIGAANGSEQWLPAPPVGVGAAVAPQWVNYSEYGRCLDVPAGNVSATHLIAYPCHSNPAPSGVGWNEKFASPTIAPGQVSVTGTVYTTSAVDGRNYCLTSPATEGGLVTVSACVPSQANQTWTVYGGDRTLRYSVKYTVVDGSGRCLGLTAPVAPDTAWSAIDTEKCTGATAQKWNADANLATSTQQNTGEK